MTDPEPLPDGHPLWDLDNCIITPHTADTEEMIDRLLGRASRPTWPRSPRASPCSA